MCSCPFEFNRSAAAKQKIEKMTMLLVLKDILYIVKRKEKQGMTTLY
jgi:hypothetical protein